jgi:hypothetical protein
METNFSETFTHIAKKYIPKTYKNYFDHDINYLSQVIKDLLKPEKLAFYEVITNIESTTICQVMYDEIRTQFKTELPGFLDRIEEDYYHFIKHYPYLMIIILPVSSC